MARAGGVVPWLLSLACVACAGPLVHLEIHYEHLPRSSRDLETDACLRADLSVGDRDEGTYFYYSHFDLSAATGHVDTVDFNVRRKDRGDSVHFLLMYFRSDGRVLSLGEGDGIAVDDATIPVVLEVTRTQ